MGLLSKWLGRRDVVAPDASALYASLFGAGDRVFDVGANVGDRTAVFRALGARVVAIEPQGACLARLRERFSGDDDVVVVPRALGSEPGFAELAICDEAPTISTMSEAWRADGRFATTHTWSHTERVEVTTLDALIAEHGLPRFTKVDVEGFEEQVLAGLTRALPCTSFEFTREFFPAARACIDRLAALAPVEVNASLGESLTWLSPRWLDPPALLALLAERAEPDLWGDIYVRTISG